MMICCPLKIATPWLISSTRPLIRLALLPWQPRRLRPSGPVFRPTCRPTCRLLIGQPDVLLRQRGRLFAHSSRNHLGMACRPLLSQSDQVLYRRSGRSRESIGAWPCKPAVWIESVCDQHTILAMARIVGILNTNLCVHVFTWPWLVCRCSVPRACNKGLIVTLLASPCVNAADTLVKSHTGVETCNERRLKGVRLSQGSETVALHCLKGVRQWHSRGRGRCNETARREKNKHIPQHSNQRHRKPPMSGWYGVATISRMLKNIGLFCKRALQKKPIFCKETYIFKHPTHRSHPIVLWSAPERTAVIASTATAMHWAIHFLPLLGMHLSWRTEFSWTNLPFGCFRVFVASKTSFFWWAITSNCAENVDMIQRIGPAYIPCSKVPMAPSLYPPVTNFLPEASTWVTGLSVDVLYDPITLSISPAPWMMGMSLYIYTNTCIYIYIYIYMCVCVCVRIYMYVRIWKFFGEWCENCH